MPFPLFGHRDRISPIWSFTPGGILWRLLPTTTGGFVGESRDSEALRVSFFHIEARSGAARWKDRAWGEPWWTGLETVHGSVAILHEFAKPDMPDHGRIHVVDLATGDLLWSAAELTFAAAAGDRLLATRLDAVDRQQLILDLRSGEQVGLRDPSVDADEWTLSSGALHAAAEALQFPEPIAPANGDPNGGSTEEEIRGNGWKVLGSYEVISAAGPLTMRQRLRVFDAKGRSVFDQVIHSSARSVVHDTFFVWDGILYFLKEQRSLVAVRLP
ncbi:MAG: DUF4905 domain-containing protein [Bacteroidetes bacterium]|jgi:hypothetical protein|nr:DUF4905 domain-containing protein [Bacteroidota bacterium]